MTLEHIENTIERLNIGFGYFQCWEIDNSDNEDHSECIQKYLREQYSLGNTPHLIERRQRALNDLQKFSLHPIDNYEKLIQEKTTEWLNFSNPYAPTDVNSDEIDHLKQTVLNEVFKYLKLLKIENAYFIDESFDDYYTPWGDQMSFDIVCCSKTKIFIYHSGWSS